MELQTILTQIFNIGLTDDELEYNISNRGGWQINKGEIKINISGILSETL